MNETLSKLFGNISYNDTNQWYSTKLTPFERNQDFSYRYYNPSNTEQLIGSTIHNWRLESNDFGQKSHEFKDDLMFEFRANSRKSVKREMDWSEDKPTKRSKIYDSFNGYDSSHSRTQEFRPNCGKDSNTSSKDLSIDLFCKTCDSFSYSFLDFSNHLKGKRHKYNLRYFDHSKHMSVCHKLQELLDNSKEPIVGLDFVIEVKNNKFIEEISFDCILCNCHQMSIKAILQHISGFRHRYDFAKFIDSNKRRQILLPFVSRQKDNEIVRSLAQKYQNLYGRGNCRFIRKNCCQRAQASNASSAVGTSTIGTKTCDTMPLPSNRNNLDLDFESDSNKKAIEAFEAIRKTCDKMITYYSMKQKFCENTFETNLNESNSCLPSNGVVSMDQNEPNLKPISISTDHSIKSEF